ncbi:MAG: AraC family transcriptional regulator [Roseburia sp.]|nr:AraC family transcriptional regulator [Roseburia sp.]
MRNDNFSYFSRLFKNYSGLSPKEYRSGKIKSGST